MIKVEHTKTLEVNKVTSGIPNRDVILVTDTELVLMESSGEGNSILVNQLWVKPILISKTEKIEVGDKLEWKGEIITFEGHKKIDSIWKEAVKANRKVLALSEHFSPEQLQMIVDGKLKDGDKVLVECIQGEWVARENKVDYDHLYQIKLNPHITIYPVEEKMYTRDEVYEIIIKFNRYHWKKRLLINQNAQPLYTEQDMRAAFKAGGAVGNFHSEKRRYFDTFEQFLDSYTKPKNTTT